MGEPPIAPQFIHLRARSGFSLCQGAIPVKRLARLALDHGQPAVALTDSNNLFGALEFSKHCSECGIQPIIGAIVTLYSMDAQSQAITTDELVLLCQNENGYKNLSKIVSNAHLNAPAGQPPMANISLISDLSAGIIALWGGRGSLLFSKAGAYGADDLIVSRAEYLNRCFDGRMYIEVQRCQELGEHKSERMARKLASNLSLPLVATNDVFFGRKDEHLAQDILMCIGQGRYEVEENRPRLTKEHYFKSAAEMAEAFSDLPEAIDSTVEIAQRCAFRVWYRKSILPTFPLPDGNSAESELRRQSYAGFAQRFESVRQRLGSLAAEKVKPKYIERLEYELGVIEKTGFAGYFLIVSDFMIWTKNQGIPIGVRGSGATSIVAWCIYITQLDPVRFDLVFERFLNPERISLPDFDIDFCQDRRGEVINYVRQKYGPECVAQIVTFGTLQAKAAVKDVGRVVGAPFPLVDRMSKLIGDAKSLDEAISSESDLKNIYETDDMARRCFDLAKGVEGLYRHASTHAAGVIIANKPIVEYLPLYKDPNSDMPVTQFHFKDAEAVGLVKFDFLGLRTLTIVAKAIELIERKTGIKIDVESLPFDDQMVYQMLQSGDTTGVFQLESSGMKDLLKRMRPTSIDHLIALISLYRPGPMDSIPSYIARANGKEPVTYDHPILEKVLSDTYGVITYQEHVMQIARDLSGYSLGEADLLRRAMGKKIASEMDKQWERFSSGAEDNGVPKHVAKAVFDKCAKFAGYGFNKGHAAAYAQVSFQTAFLKYHYPLEFYSACMTVDSESVERLSIYVKEIRNKGTEVLPPAINHATHEFIVETCRGKSSIRYSLSALKGVGTGIVNQIIAERDRGGQFDSVENVFVRCAPFKVSRATWERFIDAGVFDTLHENRSEIKRNIKQIMVMADETSRLNGSDQSGLFGVEAIPPRILTSNSVSQGSSGDFDNEKSVFGFYFSGHPISRFHHLIDQSKFVSVGDLIHNKSRVSGCYELVCMVEAVQVRRSSKSGNKYAFVQISDMTGALELMAFSDVLEHRRDLLRVGTKAVARCSVEVVNDSVRYTLVELESAVKMLSNSGSIHVVLLGDDSFYNRISLLQSLCVEFGGGDTEVFVNVKAQNSQQTTIRLPVKLNLSADLLDKLMDLGKIDCGVAASKPPSPNVGARAA